MLIFFFLIFLNLLIILNLSKLANIINIYDVPDKKLKLHKKRVPILGGLIFFINLLFLIFYQLIFLDKFFFLELNLYKMKDIVGILVLIIGFFILGIYDDKYNLTPIKKIIYTIIFIIISTSLNKTLEVSQFSISFYNYKIFLNQFYLVFTIFCILIFLNSLNFYDGINGQSCIFFILIFFYLFLKSNFNEFYLYNILILFIILSLNLKSKIFLGDGGIFLLVAIASVSLIYEHNFMGNIRFVDEIFFLLLLPGFDLLRLTLTRIKNGKNAFLGDRNHIHHLINNKLSLIYTNTILLTISLIPITLFSYFKLSFEITFITFIFLYCVLIFIFKPRRQRN